MSGTFLKWGIPAFVTVVGGTYAAVAMSGSSIPGDLAVRASIALDGPEFSWVDLKVDMQDITVAGTAPNSEVLAEAVHRVAQVHGVMSVASEAQVAAALSPYPFVISVDKGQLTLKGAVPDEATRRSVLAEAGAGAIDQLQIAPGIAELKTWMAAVSFALGEARRLKAGEVALSDLALTLSGEAKSPEDYEVAAGLDPAALPPGVELGYHEVAPAQVSPYIFGLDLGAGGLTLSGYVPDHSVVDQIKPMLPAGLVIVDKTKVAGGAPQGFETRVQLLAQALTALSAGQVSLSGETVRLAGTPHDPVQRNKVIALLGKEAVSLDFRPPEVVDWALLAEIGKGGLQLSGTLPAGLRASISGRAETDADAMSYEELADPGLAPLVEFALSAAGHLSTGRAELKDGRLTLAGVAKSPEAYAEIQHLLTAAPKGLTIAQADIHPAAVSPYRFSIEKTSGALIASGFVPDEGTLGRVNAIGTVTGSLAIAAGAPAGFDSQLQAALSLLGQARTGQVVFDGTAWVLKLEAESPIKAIALKADFALSALSEEGGKLELLLPAAPPPAALPVVANYNWRLVKSDKGAFAIAGHSPSEAFKRYLAVHLRAEVSDKTELAAGEPDTFTNDAVRAAEAVAAMRTGEAALVDGHWSISGQVARSSDRDTILAQLGDDARSKWKIAIAAADDLPVADPYIWSVARAAQGGFVFEGAVPTAELKQRLGGMVGPGGSNATTIAAGAPKQFDKELELALRIADELKSGRVAFDGRRWTVQGTVDSEAQVAALRSELDAAGAPGEWQFSVVAPAEVKIAPAVEPAVETKPAEQPEAKVADLPSAQTDTEAQSHGDAPSSVDLSKPFRFEFRKEKSGVATFEGAVPDDQQKTALATALKLKEVPEVALDATLPGDFADHAQIGLQAIALLTDGVVGLQGERWVIAGRVRDQAAQQSVASLLAGPSAHTDWVTDLKPLPERELCQDALQVLAARNAIVFEAGSAVLTKASATAIDELASDLALCPSAAINVEGHTDADGDPDANLALSVARAEAVVDQLMQRGIGPDRLYAVGYGASMPIASNETKAGKQANRRIAFSLADE